MNSKGVQEMPPTPFGTRRWLLVNEAEFFQRGILGRRLHDEEISTSYNSKYQVEDDFKWLKDKLMVPVKPVHVWTDQHIRGHVFVCVMGLLFYRYIQWRLRSSGLKWSTQKLASVLEGIRLALILKDKTKKKGSIVVERMDKDEARLFSELDLAEYVKA